MRLTNFKIESLGYETFEGFTKNEQWNGWDCPYFTFAQAQKVLKTYNELCQLTGQTNPAYFDSSDDAFVFPSDENEIFYSVAEDGQKYYPIGASCWIWEETEK